jgi:predicted patatin/cPLA2 family phospholipase
VFGRVGHHHIARWSPPWCLHVRISEVTALQEGLSVRHTKVQSLRYCFAAGEIRNAILVAVMKSSLEIQPGVTKQRALLIQGGGLRGAYAVGALRGLYDAGLGESFDQVIAVSSAVFAASYFVAGQVKEMEDAWRNLVHGRQLISYRNIFSMTPVLGLDYLVALFKGAVRLHTDRIVSSRTALEFVTTDYLTGEPKYLDAKRSDIFDLMRASSAVPRLYPLPVRIDGHEYYDGGHSDPIPVQRAIDLGYKNILVVLTKPLAERKVAPSKLLGYLLLYPAHKARESWLKIHETYNRALDLISRPPPGIQITAIAPAVSHISRLTRKRSALMHAIEQGKKDAERYVATCGSLCP